MRHLQKYNYIFDDISSSKLDDISDARNCRSIEHTETVTKSSSKPDTGKDCIGIDELRGNASASQPKTARPNKHESRSPDLSPTVENRQKKATNGLDENCLSLHHIATAKASPVQGTVSTTDGTLSVPPENGVIEGRFGSNEVEIVVPEQKNQANAGFPARKFGVPRPKKARKLRTTKDGTTRQLMAFIKSMQKQQEELTKQFLEGMQRIEEESRKQTEKMLIKVANILVNRNGSRCQGHHHHCDSTEDKND